MIKGGHIPVLDSLRAFAALSVCLFHFICTTIGFVKTEWVVQMFSFGKYGVQLFFVISGFVIPWAMYRAGYRLKNFFSFFLKRLARLEPPYIFSIVIALSVLFLREEYFGKPNEHIQISLNQVFLHAGYLIPFNEGYQWLNPVYWTLAVEFQYYLFIALLFAPLVNANHLLRYVLYALVLLLSLLGSSAFLFYWLPFFLSGILIFLFKTNLIQKNEYYIVSTLVLIFCFFRYPAGAVIYSCLPVVCVLFFEDLKISGLHFLGKFSYSIYLIHPILGASLINVLSHHVSGPLAKAGLVILGTGITLLFAWLTFLFIEKPSKNLSASVKY